MFGCIYLIPFCPLDCLNDKDLKQVRKAVWEARSKWFDLGIELDIHVETLKVRMITCNYYDAILLFVCLWVFLIEGV